MKRLFIFILILSFVASAGVKQLDGYSDKATYYQFTHIEETNSGDYHDGRNAGQDWLGAQTITLNVPAEMDVWVSNYVNSWYEPIAPLDGNIYDMGAEKYGAWQTNGDGEWAGNGESRTVMFTDGAGHDNLTTAYFLGHFRGGEQIAMWIKAIPDDGGETVTWQQPVADDAHDTSLVSRLDGTHDIADNVRINIGLYGIEEGREYIAFGACDFEYIKGQPLPSVLFSSLLAIGSIAGVGRLKRR